MAEKAEEDRGCEPVGKTFVRCMCGVTRGCGCVLTNPPTHFHPDGRRLGAQCKDCPVCAATNSHHTWRHARPEGGAL